MMPHALGTQRLFTRCIALTGSTGPVVLSIVDPSWKRESTIYPADGKRWKGQYAWWRSPSVAWLQVVSTVPRDHGPKGLLLLTCLSVCHGKVEKPMRCPQLDFPKFSPANGQSG